MAEYTDLDRRLDELVRISALHSQRIHEMMVAIRERGQRRGREIDCISDALMRRHEQRRSIDSGEGRVTRTEDEPQEGDGNA